MNTARIDKAARFLRPPSVWTLRLLPGLCLGLCLGGALAQAQTAPKNATPATGKPTPAVTAEAKAPAKPSAAQGQAIYLKNCAGCHGRQVEGGIAPSIRAAGQVSLEQFKQAILHGKGLDGRLLRPTMPRFNGGFQPHPGKAPSDQDIQSLQLYLKQAK